MSEINYQRSADAEFIIHYVSHVYQMKAGLTQGKTELLHAQNVMSTLTLHA